MNIYLRLAYLALKSKAGQYIEKEALKKAAIYGRAAGGRLVGSLDDLLIRAEGRLGIAIIRGQAKSLGLEAGKAPNIATRAASKLAWNYLYPITKPSAFFSGFVSGFSRQGINSVTNLTVDALLGTPKYISKYPYYSAFVKNAAKTFKAGTGASDISVNRLSSIFKAVKTIEREASMQSRTYKVLMQEGAPDWAAERYLAINRWERAGWVTSILGGKGLFDYVVVGSEERDKRIEKFKKTFWGDARKQGKVWVNSYTREGHRVRGYYRTQPV